MANWDKLHKELDDVLDNLTDADWEDWAKNREIRKAMRRKELMMKAKMQEEKLYLAGISGQKLMERTVSSAQNISIPTIAHTTLENAAGSPAKIDMEYYAFAA